MAPVGRRMHVACGMGWRLSPAESGCHLHSLERAAAEVLKEHVRVRGGGHELRGGGGLALIVLAKETHLRTHAHVPMHARRARRSMCMCMHKSMYMHTSPCMHVERDGPCGCTCTHPCTCTCPRVCTSSATVHVHPQVHRRGRGFAPGLACAGTSHAFSWIHAQAHVRRRTR